MDSGEQIQSDALQNGLPEADFMRLFLRHEQVLRAYARTILPDWDRIDDALQEASVTMWKKRSQLESVDGFLPWAKVVVRFKCLHAVKKFRRERPLLSDQALQLLADEGQPDSLGQFNELTTVLRTCLADFTEAHQELLLAPYSNEGRVKQLAEKSGRSANSLYKLLGRLRQKLTGCIQSRTQTVEG